MKVGLADCNAIEGARNASASVGLLPQGASLQDVPWPGTPSSVFGQTLWIRNGSMSMREDRESREWPEATGGGGGR